MQIRPCGPLAGLQRAACWRGGAEARGTPRKVSQRTCREGALSWLGRKCLTFAATEPHLYPPLLIQNPFHPPSGVPHLCKAATSSSAR